MYNPTAPSLSIIRKFSVRPMVTTEKLSPNKIYPVLYMEVFQGVTYYNVRGDDGITTYIAVGAATIEDIEH